MAVKVLVVDDSSFFRRRVSEILEQDSGIEVIGFAVNGREAVEKTAQLRPDVITMDVEMPVLDGISAVKEIMASNPTPILMFSSLTRAGASATLDALDAGAMDFLPKKFEDIARNNDDAIKLLQNKVKEIGRQRIGRITRTAPSPSISKPASNSSERFSNLAKKPIVQPDRSFNNASPASTSSSASARASGKQYQLVAIGTSTGGPVALQTILTQLPANFPHPILLIQHMPAAFTPAFATRLDGLCKIKVKEAQQGDRLQPGCAYLAPGGQQMMVEGRGSNRTLRVFEDKNERVNYKPSVDITFASAAKAYQGDVLAIILTGMGADGRDGARMLKQTGATIWAQDEKSCVVYGMPQAIASAGLASESISLHDVAARLKREAGCG
ncbi:two-component system, chemotaxis family, response regulator CheB [Pseudoalteromonas undina]|jgi:two-component system chemotaxis response regulator CheB|uniref:Protein-glutamate methylesterase/protein-glutamine glutaminase n=2 Tax=Pseudoalteromonas TaxID=53246 RepID=A0AA37S1A5_9GAMM|nr:MULTISPECIES: chemotaxis response regulator protein-glutamate methylesterase [Pseudoalteromonas]MAY59365.1 chemotaxis response regulator protein-glutamate methylesterase [Pseudoalteromonas sp.]ATD03863.1 two-component system, chemotaxis family, response regulator CheB [Pseudoalteromonas tetraodonis]KAF7765699.1 two-component system, chemotaxis family, response regulator CheB [Pseudoalteromonas undina]MDN3408461.1 chemotaxis response regulator protein-glutamate methylesterase [Pseudoalteromon|tara:strand:- start:17858 stop:19009 length:1152 start_codon:yes stop_codon:yes gene_type:complete